MHVPVTQFHIDWGKRNFPTCCHPLFCPMARALNDHEGISDAVVSDDEIAFKMDIDGTAQEQVLSCDLSVKQWVLDFDSDGKVDPIELFLDLDAKEVSLKC